MYEIFKSQNGHDGWDTFLFKFPFSHLLVSFVFRTFLKLISSNKKYILRKESFYSFHKFKENPPIFTKLS
jgi:hypothetical protein